MKIYSSRELMNQHVYFSHINKVTQYARPNMNQEPTISNVYPISARDSNGFYSSKMHTNYSNHAEERAVDAPIKNIPLNNGTKNFLPLINNNETHDTLAIWQKNNNNVLNKLTNEASSSSSSISNTSNNKYNAIRILNNDTFNGNSHFTQDPNQLKGQILNTRIQKGDKGLGFTLIGNDGNNSELEFIQVNF